MKRWILRGIVSACAMVAAVSPLYAQGTVRIKDVTDFEGSESNRLIGYGLVVGLNGTGGKSSLTQKTAVDMLQRFKVASKFIGDGRDPIYRSGNVSAVMITAEIGPFARIGSRIDVTVSVLDDATSLQGGQLLWTPLKGVDEVDYVLAGGNVNCGAFLATASGGGGGTAASATKNHPTVGQVVNGGQVVRECRGRLLCNGILRILIRDPDPTTAGAVAKSINTKFYNCAFPADNGTVHVYVPSERCSNLVGFMSTIGTLEITPDSPARVLINSRTGTIIAGHNVKINSVAVTHGNLAIVVNNEPKVSQPNSFSGGKTKTVPSAQIGVTEQGGSVNVMEQTMTVGELANALNRLGASPRDLITIFEGLKRMGALHADLVPMQPMETKEDSTMESLTSVSPSLTMPLPGDLEQMANPRHSPDAIGKSFESMIASMLIKQMRQTLDGETMFGKDSGDVMGGLFDQMLGDHLGNTGAFGVSAMIRAQLERRGAAT